MEKRPTARRISCTAALLTLALPSGLRAGPVFNYADGTHAARATFDQHGTTLSLTLENTSTFDVLEPEDVLTGVFFDIRNLGGAQLTPRGAHLTDGSSILFYDNGWNGHDNWDDRAGRGGLGDFFRGWGDDDDGDDGIGGEYGYRDLLVGVLPDVSMVISAVGMDDLVGSADLFPGDNLDGPRSPNGIDFGLVSAFDDPDSGNRAVTGKDPLVSYGVRFELSGLPDDFDLDGNVGGVRFNYGSNFNPVPEPSTLVLMALGAAAAFVRRRRPV